MRGYSMRNVLKFILILLLVFSFSLNTVSCSEKGILDSKNPTPEEQPDEQPDEKPIALTIEHAKYYIFSAYSSLPLAPVQDFAVVGKIVLDGVTFTVAWETNIADVIVEKSLVGDDWIVNIPDANDSEKAYVLTATISDPKGDTAEVAFTKMLPVITPPISPAIEALQKVQAYIVDRYKDREKTISQDYDVLGEVVFNNEVFNVTWTVSIDTITIKKSTETSGWIVDLPEVNEVEKAYQLNAVITDTAGNNLNLTFDMVLPVFNSAVTPSQDIDLKSAYDLVHNLSKDIAAATGANYDLVGSVKVKDKNYKVEWTVSDERVVLEVSEDGLTVTVKVPEPTVDIPYTLKFTVTNEKGESLSREYSHYVPKFKVNTHEEYLAASTNDPLVVEGIVVAINSKAAGNTRNHLFLADANVTGGYYIYQMDVDPVVDLGIQVGMTVRVTGPASPYSGMQEIKGGVPEIIDTTIKTVSPLDITAAFASGADLKAYVGLPVTIKGVTIGGQELGGTSDYLNFSLNGKESYVRSYKTDLPTSFANPAASKAAIEAAHAAHYNWTADVTGILILYSGNPYLIPMTEDCFNFLAAKELTDAEKVADALNNITVPGAVTADTTLELPLAGKNYADVVISWTLEGADFSFTDGGAKLPITLGSSAVTLKLTATATLGEVTETKEFTVEVAASLVMNENHAYSTYLNQVNAGKVLYLDGGVSTRYLTTTPDPSKGVAVYAEQATGGYKLYILVEGAKQYITIYTNADSKTSVNYDANGTTVFTYNKTVNAWTTVFGGKDVYLGCYNSFETVSVSELSYITAENTGKTQFPLEILDVAVNTPINLFVNQVNAGKVIYLDGGVSTRYLTTTTDITAAAAIYAEKVAGGYKFYKLDGETKMYITIYTNADSKTSVNYDAAGETVYTYAPAVNAWTTVFGGKDVYLGCYNSFETVSVSDLSYITAENTGKTQFPLDVVAGTPASTPSCEHTNTETATTDATCTVAGSTTVTCTDCGEVVSTTAIPATGHTMSAATCVAPATCSVCGTTEGEAAGHTFVEGTCSVCGTTESHVCEFVAGETVAPTCTEAGYTVYNCTCGATENRDEVAATGHEEVEETEPATCTTAGAVKVVCANCETVISSTPTEKLPHADANDDFKCDACSAVVAPAEGEALTIAQALALGKLYTKDNYTTTKYYITGVITEVQNTTYGNVVISDGTNTILVYGLYDATGKTRYDALSYKPVKGDEITVYGIIGFYNAAQMKNGWLDEVVAHDHDYDHVVTDPTCTVAGYTTHTCAICDGSYKDTEVEALGHTTDNGTCERCGQTITPGTVTKDTFTADFNTVANTNTSYTTVTTTDGWKATNAAVLGGGTSDSNPKFKVIGDAATRAFAINGKTTTKGTITSPTLNGGLSKLTFTYANCYSESNGVDITITIKQNGEVVATKRLDNNSVTKLTAYEFVWDLEAEGVAVTGDFTIEITNNSPTNKSSGNADRVAIWNLQWTNNPEA